MAKQTIALVGNPNVGKSTVFNRLTGLRQKIGNYPGITVERKVGQVELAGIGYQLVDLPGTYGLQPTSLDEQIVAEVLLNPAHENHPDVVVVVGETFNLRRALFLLQQVQDLGLPCVLVVNMIDEAQRGGLSIDLEKLERVASVPVILSNARTGEGMVALKLALAGILSESSRGKSAISDYKTHFHIPQEYQPAVTGLQQAFPTLGPYQAWLYLTRKSLERVDPALRQHLSSLHQDQALNPAQLQVAETLKRHEQLDHALLGIVRDPAKQKEYNTEKADAILTHPVWGYVCFFALLMLIFQAIYTWSGPFMDAIDEAFSWLAAESVTWLPEGPIAGLISDGLIAGIGGIVIFVPQIAILFLFISLMEESGYMSRVVFLMDRWLRPFGLSGKSAVPLMSGVACAIPAVMSARTIENDKERLITILVTPFMTCAARLPIYIVLIGLVIPEGSVWGLNLQGLALFGMYVLGLLAALGSAWILKQLMKTPFKSYLLLEMPIYKYPVLRNVGLNVWDKTKGFLFGAGKIILAMSVILWVLGSFGIDHRFRNAEEIVRSENPHFSTEEEIENAVQSQRLEYSLLGTLGRVIEPVIEPLGYDWKMGIGLISSFAAREVFVSTMATVYSLGSTDDELTIRQRMATEVNSNTGERAYNLATGISLLLFYAFAMQCMSTIAIVRRETDSWKWTLIQLGFMTGLAYVCALLAYQLLR